MQNIQLVTPPSFHHLSNHFKLLVIAASEFKDKMLDTLREQWPDSGLLVYFVDSVEADTAVWLAYHIPFVDFAIIHVSDSLPPELLVVAANEEVHCTVEPGRVSEGLQSMLMHHAGDYSTSTIDAAMADVVRAHSKYL